MAIGFRQYAMRSPAICRYAGLFLFRGIPMSSAKTLTTSYFLFFFRAFIYNVFNAGLTLALINNNDMTRDSIVSLLMMYGLVSYVVHVLSGPFADYFGSKKLSCFSSICFLAGCILFASTALGNDQINTWSNGLLKASTLCIAMGSGTLLPALWGSIARNANGKHASIFFALPFFIVWPLGFYLWGHLVKANQFGVPLIIGIIISIISFFVSLFCLPDHQRPQTSFGSFYLKAIKVWNQKPLFYFVLLSIPMLCLANGVFHIIQYFQNSWIIHPEFTKDVSFLTIKDNFILNHFFSYGTLIFTSLITAIFATLLIPVSLAGTPENRHKRLIISIILFSVGALFCFTSPNWITFLAGCLFIAVADSIFTPTNIEYITKTAPKDLKSSWAGFSKIPFHASETIMSMAIISNLYSYTGCGNKESCWEITNPWKIVIVLLIMGIITLFCLYKHMKAFSNYNPDDQDNPDNSDNPENSNEVDNSENIDEFKPYME